MNGTSILGGIKTGKALRVTYKERSGQLVTNDYQVNDMGKPHLHLPSTHIN